MEPLSDPCKDRKVKNLKGPPHRPIEKRMIWPDKSILFLYLSWCSRLESTKGSLIERRSSF